MALARTAARETGDRHEDRDFERDKAAGLASHDSHYTQISAYNQPPMIRRYLAPFGASFTLHALAIVAVAWDVAPALAPTSGKPPRTMAVFVVPPSEDAAFRGLNPVERSAREWSVPQGDDSSLRIGALRIDVGKIGTRASVLFPFLTPGLSIDHFLNRPPRDVRTHLQNPPLSSRERGDQNAGGPLILSDAALQSLVDKAWARRNRWDAFEPLSRLAETHDPDAGMLPALLQRYRDQNSLQPYVDQSTRDPRLWAQLALAADHVDFIQFVSRYAPAHPSTKATTELLFLVDRLAEGNRDALKVLLDSDPAERLRWTQDANPQAYRLLLEIRQYYEDHLVRLGLRSDEAITVYYENVRLAILNGILRTTPDNYRANDARFLVGAIYWRQRRWDDALRCWSAMQPDQGDSHAIVNADLVQTLRGRLAGRPAADPGLHREIDQILKNEHGRWVMFSYDRLKRFGYQFDMF
jgi:hypothetical protein